MLKNIPALLALTIIAVLFNEIHGHGMMLDPVSRSSRWRYDKSAPINYDDNGLFCGGLDTQWHVNDGKCGLCGDSFSAPRPRANEIGGKYGQGVITKVYSQSKNARLGIKITTNHLGFFYFHICNLDKFKEESEECFNANKIQFADGSLKMYIGKQSGMIYPTILLPKGLTCNHCVLRWNYQAGNNWGPCGNGTSALGCGPQENFKGCSDISITKKSSKTKHIKYNLLKDNSDRKINLDESSPTKKSHSRHNDIDSILFDLEKENEAGSGFERELNTNIGNDLMEPEEKKEIGSGFSNDHWPSKKEDGAFDSAYYLLFGPKKTFQETVPDYADEKQSDTKLDEDFYDFDNDQWANNAIDNSFDDLL